MLKFDAFEQGGKNGKSERMWRAASNQQSAFKIRNWMIFPKSAYEFVDQLKAAGQGCWQILPLGPTSYGDSPYQSFSTFAGNPYFISLEDLIEEGVLTEKECDAVDFGSREDDVDYEKIYKGRYKLLRKAYERSDIPKILTL